MTTPSDALALRIAGAIAGGVIGFWFGVSIGVFADTGIRTIGGALVLFLSCAVVGAVVGAILVGEDMNPPETRPRWARKWP